MSDVASRIGGNLTQVRQRIAAAAERSGRTAAAVTLVAVTKYVPAEIALELVRAGCTRLGESRPQELWSKAAHLADPAIRWHLIGHLQRNKIRRTLPLVSLIHSVDSWRLLVAVDEIAGELDLSVDVLLEANIAHDTTKTGLPPDELEPLLQKAVELRHVTIRGLMGMASQAGGPVVARRDFARLRAWRDRLAKNCPPNVSLADLSMGMSGDFEVAIEEGATIVRVGSALFEGIEL
jgi:pyridoxal phosphate enzyme (YggS family)